MAKHADTGAGLARNLSHVVGDMVVKVRASLIPHEQRERIAATTGFMEQLETEMAPMLEAMYSYLDDVPNLDPGWRAMFDEARNPAHQTGFLIQMMAFLGGIISLAPELGAVKARQYVQDYNAQQRNIPLSPADAAQAVMRGILSEPEGDSAAATYGLTDGAFATLTEMTGEPPGAIDMINLWQQGRISEAELIRGLLFSRLNNSFIDMAKLLAVEPMSTADAIEATVKGVLSTTDGNAQFVRSGGMPDEWETLFEAAGDAIGVATAAGLRNQGLIDDDQFQQIIARSRINPIFYDVAKLQRHKFLQPYQIEQVLKNGGATPQEATQWMVNLGYGADQAAALVAAGTTPTGQKAKTDTEALIVAEYTAQVMTEADALSALVAIGYDANTAGGFLALADAKRALSQRTAAVNATRSAYIAGNITRTAASGDLDTLAIPVAARNAWLSDWDVEKSTKSKEFTTAQIGSMAKKGIIAGPEALAMWEAQGWSPTNAGLLALEYNGTFTDTEVGGMLTKGVITQAQGLTFFIANGHTEAQAADLAATFGGPLPAGAPGPPGGS